MSLSKTSFRKYDELFDLYDQYAHGQIDRRQFMSGLGKLAVGTVTAMALYDYVSPNYAQAEQVSFNDPDIKARFELIPSPKGHGEAKVYLVEPTEIVASTPTVLVIHENRGLNPYIKDVARRLAKQGIIAVAPDALHPLGGYPGNDDDGRAMQRSLDREKLIADLFATADFAKQYPAGNGKLGVTGFCFGGGIANLMAAELPDSINAAVPFYGAPAPTDKVAQIKAPVMLHFGELDKRVNARWPEYEAALKTHNKVYQAFTYPGAKHGFHNDSTPRYDPEAAELAWSRTLAFFRKHLS